MAAREARRKDGPMGPEILLIGFVLFVVVLVSSHRSMCRKYPHMQLKPPPPGPMP